MFKRTLLTIAATLVLTITAAICGFAQGANQVLNGAFTDPTQFFDWDTPVLSGTFAAASEVGTAANGPFAGNKAVLATGANGEYVELSQSGIPVSIGNIHRLNLGYLTSALTGMTAKVILDDGSGTLITYTLTNVNTGPVEFVRDFTPAGNFVKITFRIDNTGGGLKQFNFDNVSITEMQ